MRRRHVLLTSSLLIAAVGATACGADSPSATKGDKAAFCAEIRAMERSGVDVEDVNEVRRIIDDRLVPVAPDEIRDDLEIWSDAAQRVDTADEFYASMDDDPEFMRAIENLAEYGTEECGVD